MKRGGDLVRVPPEESMRAPDEHVDSLLALDEALERLEARSPRQSEVVHCRFFAGLSVTETAAVLGVSEATVKRDWSFSRAWLGRALATGEPCDP
jgi:RNA polymerase sigma factor (TIGR02999 family)